MKTAEIQVRIPNLEGDGIAEIKTITVPVTIDPDTGEELLTEEAVEMIDNTKARYMGLLLPNDIKALRQRLNLTQKQMSELLQAGEKSYTRWESGKARPSRMVNLLLRALFEGELTIEQLRRIGSARTDAALQTPLAKPTHNWAEVVDDPLAPAQWDIFSKDSNVRTVTGSLLQFPHVQTGAFIPKNSKSQDLADCAQANIAHRQKFPEPISTDDALAPAA